MNHRSRTNDILGYLNPSTMRVFFLYVGQGEATFALVPDGVGGHRSMLIDCNRAPSLGGVDLVAFLDDVLGRDDPRANGQPFLDVFVNTHPHNDHLGGIDKIRDSVFVNEVWHSGHKPSREHDGPYQDLRKLIKQVTKRGGKEETLLGSRTPTSWGAAEIQVLSPAEYIVDEIEDEEPGARDRRIHDQCAVLRLSYGSLWAQARILITGDSDKTAWQRITPYHGRPDENRVASEVLSASHHGSYTFFKDRQDDPEPYTEHLDAIAPTHVIISAPDQDDSKHGHPDDEAVEHYEAKVGRHNVHHMGSRAWTFVVDVRADGGYHLFSDRGQLAKAFPLEDAKNDSGPGNGGGGTASTFEVISRVEKSRPMGAG
jgi:beta-lactamase superfamily II metal-dependent hydrolase